MTRQALVRRVRAAFDITQTDMGAALGYQRTPWGRKETGEAPLRDVDILALAAWVNGIRTVEDAVRVIETACDGAEQRKGGK